MPRFYLKEKFDWTSRADVWEFGLITAESIAKSNEFGSDSSHIPMAQLPREVFCRFYCLDLSHKRAKRLAKQVLSAGWEWDSEEIRGACQLRHKYVDIRYWSI